MNEVEYETCEYPIRVGIALSQLINALTGGSPIETFSSRQFARRVAGKPSLVPAIDAFFMRPGHCAEAWTAHTMRERGATLK